MKQVLLFILAFTSLSSWSQCPEAFLAIDDNPASVTSATICVTNELLLSDSSVKSEDIHLWILNYGNSEIDTFFEFSNVTKKYNNPGTFAIDMTIIDETGACRDTSRNIVVVVDDKDLNTGTITVDSVECLNDSSGTIIIHSESGGTPPYQYAFSSGAFSSLRAWDNLAAGYYNISVSDSNGCIADTSILVFNKQETLDIDYDSLFNQNDVPTPNLVSETGGVFSIFPDDSASIDSVTGEILNFDYEGSYIVSYTTPGICGQVAKDTVEFNIIINVDELHEFEAYYNAYPNPFNDVFTIESNEDPLQIEMINLVGTRLFERNVIGSSHTINMSRYPSGVYFLRVNGELIKLMKE